jgi:hypothetical protein
LLLLGASASAQVPVGKGADLVRKAEGALQRGDAAAALPLYRSAWAAGIRDASNTYNAACAAALAKQPAEALVWLERAIAAGFVDRKHLMADGDLVTVRADPRFAEILTKLAASEERIMVRIKDRALRQELLTRMAEDQEARRPVPGRAPSEAEVKRIQEIDRKNTARLEEVIEKHGWPGKTLVGEDGAFAAWLMIQHADQAPAFQRRCLPLLEKAVLAGEAGGKELAYLTDRVLVADGKPQRYGTQFHQVDGQLVPREVEDPGKLEARRKKVGLPTMAEYKAMMRRTYEGKK